MWFGTAFHGGIEGELGGTCRSVYDELHWLYGVEVHAPHQEKTVACCRGTGDKAVMDTKAEGHTPICWTVCLLCYVHMSDLDALHHRDPVQLSLIAIIPRTSGNSRHSFSRFLWCHEMFHVRQACLCFCIGNCCQIGLDITIVLCFHACVVYLEVASLLLVMLLCFSKGSHNVSHI